MPDYAAATGAGVKGKRVGIPKNLIGADADCQRALDGASAALQRQGAQLVDVMLPDLDEATVQWLAQCGVEAALATRRHFRHGAPNTAPSSQPCSTLAAGFQG